MPGQQTTDQQSTDQAVLDADTAFSIVHQQVYSPVFFNKLAADYGIRPETPQNAFEILRMAERLRQSYEENQVKTASTQSAWLQAAGQHLGVAVDDSDNQVMDATIEKVAAECASDPTLATAVLSMQARAAGVV